MEKPVIGFIGLGIMGKPMAHNLLNADYRLIVHNRSQGAVGELVDLGASAASSPMETAAASDIIITMLPDSPDVEEVILGEQGVLAGCSEGSIIIDMSSIAPLVSQKIAKQAEDRGVEMLDAPVSGGEPGAIEGSLAIMVGGKKAVFDKCREVLQVMGKSVVRVGDIGAGGFAKLANQIIVALNIAALSEAFVLAQKAGLDPEILHGAIRNGLAGSNAMDAKIPKIVERDFKPGFKIKLHHKDLNNVLNTAHDLGMSLPLAEKIQEMLASLIAAGKGESDHSAIIHFQETLAKTIVEKS
jgi:2-hydroxy-3-oxopropionate reductase